MFFVLLCIFDKGKAKLTCHLSEETKFLHLLSLALLDIFASDLKPWTEGTAFGKGDGNLQPLVMNF